MCFVISRKETADKVQSIILDLTIEMNTVVVVRN